MIYELLRNHEEVVKTCNAEVIQGMKLSDNIKLLIDLNIF